MTINCTIQNNKEEELEYIDIENELREIVALFFFHKIWLSLLLNFLRKDLRYVKKYIYRLKNKNKYSYVSFFILFPIYIYIYIFFILEIFIRFIFVDEKYEHLASKCTWLISILFFQIFWNVTCDLSKFSILSEYFNIVDRRSDKFEFHILRRHTCVHTI